jgi:hypothetical protein
MDVSSINLLIQAHGSAKILKNIQICIDLPEWITVQAVKNTKLITISNGKKCSINLAMLLPTDSKKKETIKTKVELALIKDCNPESREIELRATLKNKNFVLKRLMCKYQSNSNIIES